MTVQELRDRLRHTPGHLLIVFPGYRPLTGVFIEELFGREVMVLLDDMEEKALVDNSPASLSPDGRYANG